MILSLLLAGALVAAPAAAPPAPPVPPVPGLCTAPVPADPETPGCYMTNVVELADAPPMLYWHIREFDAADEAQAQAEAQRHRWAAVTRIHGRTWLYVLSERDAAISGGTARAVIGPLTVPRTPATALFSEAIFPPGMRTRVHSHPGPEAFYVVEGEQCMESPTDRRVIGAGGTYIVASGPHLQAAPKGRRNLVLILAPAGMAPVVPGGDWTPGAYCGGGAQADDRP